MEYFAGLDVSMAETQICVVTRTVIHKAKVPSNAGRHCGRTHAGSTKGTMQGAQPQSLVSAA
jgi:hypothetical protein